MSKRRASPDRTDAAHGAVGELSEPSSHRILKSPTGIAGLDELTGGGLPAGRPTLVCGGPGAGKTLLAATFLGHGARDLGEPGVLMTFEENAQEIASDVASLEFDLQGLIDEGKLIVDYVHLDRSEIEEAGDYDLEGLFVRLDYAIRSIGARRVVLDTVEALFGGFSNERILRAELRRLFRWLKERGVTSVITGERGDASLTRQGLEEYISDAVLLLDHRVQDGLSTRRLRVVKYRGSPHGTNEYPFLIGAEGLSVLPVTSLGLRHGALTERVSSGVPALDDMMGGRGFFRGSTVLVSGTAGTGKTSLAAHFVHETCRRGERCLYVLHEESPDQLIRNMRAIGVDLRQWVDRGLLKFCADRPSRFGLEQHLLVTLLTVRDFAPSAVVVDPITGLMAVGAKHDVHAMLARMIDHLKSAGVTGLFTSLTHSPALGDSDTAISSLIDTWLTLSLTEADREHRRSISVLKSRGMAHSNRIRTFRLTDTGIDVLEGGRAMEGV